MRMVLSCLLERTLHYTRVFWDTFSSKHNSMCVKISLVSSRGECGSSWDLMVVVDNCLIANSSEHRGLGNAHRIAEARECPVEVCLVRRRGGNKPQSLVSLYALCSRLTFMGFFSHVPIAHSGWSVCEHRG